MANQSKLKAWVRYDGTGRVVTAGPIFQANKPKVGNWRQINADLCCNPSGSTTTTTTTQGGGGNTPTAFVVRISGAAEVACDDNYGYITVVYSNSGSPIVGSYFYSDAALTALTPDGRSWVRDISTGVVYETLLGQIVNIFNCTVTTTTTSAPGPIEYVLSIFNYDTPGESCSNGAGSPNSSGYSFESNPLAVTAFYTSLSFMDTVSGLNKFVAYAKASDPGVVYTARIDESGVVTENTAC